MPTPALLFVDDRGFRLVAGARAETAPPDAASLLRLLAAVFPLRRPPLLIVNALSGESFRLETLPAGLSPREKREVVQRLRQKHCGDAACATVLLPSQQATAAERALFVAAESPLLPPLLAALTEAGVKIAGLYSLALLLGEFCRTRITPLPDALLLVSRHAGDIRETCLWRGVAVFSRLLPPPDADEPWSRWLLSETETLSRYLHGQGFDAPELALTLAGFGEAPQLATDTGSPALSHLPAIADLEQALPAWLSATPPKSHFPVASRRFSHWQTWQPRLAPALWLLGGLACLAGSAWGFWQWQAARPLEAQRSALAAQIAAAEKNAPPSTQATEELARLEAFFREYDALRAEAATPCLELELPSQILDKNPEARLERIVWRCGQTLTLEATVPDPAGLETLARWLESWQPPPGWRVELPEMPNAALAPDAAVPGAVPFQLRLDVPAARPPTP